MTPNVVTQDIICSFIHKKCFSFRNISRDIVKNEPYFVILLAQKNTLIAIEVQKTERKTERKK